MTAQVPMFPDFSNLRRIEGNDALIAFLNVMLREETDGEPIAVILIRKGPGEWTKAVVSTTYEETLDADAATLRAGLIEAAKRYVRRRDAKERR